MEIVKYFRLEIFQPEMSLGVENSGGGKLPLRTFDSIAWSIGLRRYKF